MMSKFRLKSRFKIPGTVDRRTDLILTSQNTKDDKQSQREAPRSNSPRKYHNLKDRIMGGLGVHPSFKHQKRAYENFKLYAYWRSSSSWRVRTVLAAKGVQYEAVSINFEKGDNRTDDFLKKNPLGQVPVLEFTETETNSTFRLTQSVAIIEFLDSNFPGTNQLISRDPLKRAMAMEIVEIINSGIQPLQNSSLLALLRELSNETFDTQAHAKDVISRGLRMVDILLKQERSRIQGDVGPFGLGTASPTIVDVYLVPQLYNSRRYGLALDSEFPSLASIEAECLKHPWFIQAHPDQQDN